MPLSNGETFAGFRIVRLLGSGERWARFAWPSTRLPPRDALKILSSAVSADTVFGSGSREADIAAALSHPHTVVTSPAWRMIASRRRVSRGSCGSLMQVS